MFNFNKRKDDQLLITEIKQMQQMIIDITYDIAKIKQETVNSNPRKEIESSIDRMREARAKVEKMTEGVFNSGNHTLFDFKKNQNKEQIIKKLKEYLSTVEYLPVSEMIEFLHKDGVIITTKNPQSYVSQLLSKSPEFECDRRQGYGWKLKDKSNLWKR